MRKGRSSRRSRVSRPSIGPKTLQNVEAVAAQPAAPNVVIGVSVPPVAPSEPPRAEADAGTNVAPALQSIPGPSPVPVEATAHEPASEQRLKAEAAATLEQAIDELDAAPAGDETKPAEKTEEKPDTTDEPKAAAAEARDEPSPPEPPAGVDEESIPPAGDLAVHEEFFSQGDVASLAADDDDDLAAADKAVRKSAPEVVERRARFVRYVTWAVGVSAVVCLAAVVRTAFTPSSKTIAAPAQAAMIVEPPAAKAAPRAEPAQPAAATPPAAAEPPATTATTAPEAPAPAAIEPTEAPKPAPTGDAKEEKAACRSALERGKVADAIEAGERAVALDETDAEAWLLLGAAYQEKGKLADARRAYTSCVKLGVKGKHTTECAQMLR